MKRRELWGVFFVAFVTGAACAGNGSQHGLVDDVDAGSGGGGTTSSGGSTGDVDGGSSGGGGGDIDDGGVIVPAGDGLPKGSVTYFETLECPAGWEPWLFADGRTIVPTADVDDRRTFGGSALEPGEPLTHDHTVAGSITVKRKKYTLVDGCCNNALGNYGTGVYPFSTTTTEAESGIPYVLMMVCRKTQTPEAGAPDAPTGTLMFFDLPACPSGWTLTDVADGRYIVGLPEGGPNGATWGGAPVSNGSLPRHTHTASGKFTISGHGIAGASIGGANSWADDGERDFSTTTGESTVGFPYVQLIQCRKD